MTYEINLCGMAREDDGSENYIDMQFHRPDFYTVWVGERDKKGFLMDTLDVERDFDNLEKARAFANSLAPKYPNSTIEVY